MLAFDRDRIRHLGHQVTVVTETIARWAVTEHDALEASRSLAAARSLLHPWSARLAEIAASDVMESHPAIAHRDGTRLGVEARLLAEHIGWQVVSDGSDGRLLDDARLMSLMSRLDDESFDDLLRAVLDTGDPDMLALVAHTLPPLVAGRCGPTDALLARLAPASVSALAVHLGPTPAAARAVLDAVERLDGGLALLVYGDADPNDVTELVVRAVSDLDAAAAGPTVLAHTRLVVAGGTSDDGAYRRLLGGLVAPYLLQFTSRAGDWGLEQRDGARLLADVLRDAGAMAALLASRARWAPMAVTDGDRAAHDLDTLTASLDDMAGMLGWFDAIVHAEEVDDAIAQRALWEVSWYVIGSGVNLAIRATGVTGGVHTLADRVADEVLERVKVDMERDGAFGAPGTEHAIEVAGEKRHDLRRATLAAAAATATVEVLRAHGRVVSDPPRAPRSPGECSSTEWLDAFDAWSATLDRSTRRAVHHTVRTVLNRYQSAEACFRLDAL